MTIHWLQHVPFEGLGCIEPLLKKSGQEIRCIRLWNSDSLPSADEISGLIIMGGPMGISDESEYPWLSDEKTLIKNVIGQNKPVLGICLGAQLIADALGAEVWRNEEKEIGFFPLKSNGQLLPKEFTAFHWHGDTFGIPEGAERIASSEATKNQAFLYNNNVLALQFHLETTEESLNSLYANCSGEITDSSFIQNLEQVKPFFPTLKNANRLMADLLGKLFGKF